MSHTERRTDLALQIKIISLTLGEVGSMRAIEPKSENIDRESQDSQPWVFQKESGNGLEDPEKRIGRNEIVNFIINHIFNSLF